MMLSWATGPFAAFRANARGAALGIAGRIHVRCSLRQQAICDLSAQRVVIEARQG